MFSFLLVTFVLVFAEQCHTERAKRIATIWHPLSIFGPGTEKKEKNNYLKCQF
jgi:hypothetical protein